MESGKSKVKINELIFAIYIVLFPGLNYFYKDRVLNYIFIAILIGTFLIYNFIKSNRNESKVSPTFIIVNMVMIFLFILTIIFKDNSMVYDYIKKYILYGFLTMLFFSKVYDYDKLLYYMSILYLLLFVLSIQDPFKNYEIYSTYMSFGLFCALPCFVIFHVERKYFGKKLFIIPELLSVVSLMYSNRNAIFVAIVSVLVLDTLIKPKNKKKIIKYIIIAIALIVVIINSKAILEYISSNFNLHGYAIRSLIQWVDGKSNGLTGRDLIWGNAINDFLNYPIFGLGLGGFHAKYEIYCHNVILDVLVSTGIIGFILMGVFIFLSLKNYNENRNKLFFTYIFLMGFLPLMFNNYFMTWKYFWIAIYLGIDKCKISSIMKGINGKNEQRETIS